jgi:hypothetical protein
MPTALRFARFAVLLALTLASLGSAVAAASADQVIGAAPSCDSAPVGQIGCDAQVLVSERTHKPVHPRPRRVGPEHVVGRVAPDGAPGLAAPQPMTPAYLQQAYDLSYLSAARGTGDTIGVVAVYDDPNAASDLNTFRSTYGLPSCTAGNGCFEQLNEQGLSSPLPATNWPWALEQSMDLDAVSSLCPNCRIVLVAADAPDATDLQTAITAAIHAGADQVSISGSGEYASNPFSDFSAPGVSILAASGDDGVVAGRYSNYPAALPYVTAVGGTSLQADGLRTPTLRGVTESAWGGSGSGCDTDEPALPYQPADGCAGRMYADVSADADPDTGLSFYDSQAGGWMIGGGTSLATPLTAAFEAVTGVDGSSPQWAYLDSANLNDPSAGSSGSCASLLQLLCRAQVGYDGPTGAGSISGQIVAGAPGIAPPPLGPAGDKTYVGHVSATNATLLAGVYPNGETTHFYWEYGATSSYGLRTAAVSVGAGTAPVPAAGQVNGLEPGSTYHFRLVTSNPTGTTYGYDYTLTTLRASIAKVKR